MAPHATGTSPARLEHRRSSSSHPRPPTTYKFPDLSQESLSTYDENAVDEASGEGTLPPLGMPNNLHSHERWQARRESRPSWTAWANGSVSGAGGERHGRQKSLTEAIRTVRTRTMSVGENAHEIADALKAPVSFKLVTLCGIWYATSILSNASSKAILTALPKPVTLTIVQFLFVCGWCLFSSWLAKHNGSLRNAAPVLKNGIRKPSKELILTTLPSTGFQIGGHILNSDAMTRIPVSLVHTIKGLSPLFTVLAYRLFFDIRYSYYTWLSLVPLTIGVVMACSASFKGNIIGLTYAFGSALLFVTQNIVSKKLFNESAKAEADGVPSRDRKPDKLNLLCYSSGLALLLTLPIWLWSEGLTIIFDFIQDASVDLSGRPGSLDHGRLLLEFIFNGTFHFAQSLVAFVLLGMVSPVTYSVASLIKRVAVIIFAVIWFGNSLTTIQAVGIGLTFVGLYLYDRMSDADNADRKARVMAESHMSLLPISTNDKKNDEHAPGFVQSPMTTKDLGRAFKNETGYANGNSVGSGPGRPRASTNVMPNANSAGMNGNANRWLPPGTKQEETRNHEVPSRQQRQQDVAVR